MRAKMLAEQYYRDQYDSNIREDGTGYIRVTLPIPHAVIDIPDGSDITEHELITLVQPLEYEMMGVSTELVKMLVKQCKNLFPYPDGALVAYIETVNDVIKNIVRNKAPFNRILPTAAQYDVSPKHCNKVIIEHHIRISEDPLAEEPTIEETLSTRITDVPPDNQPHRPCRFDVFIVPKVGRDD